MKRSPVRVSLVSSREDVRNLFANVLWIHIVVDHLLSDEAIQSNIPNRRISFPTKANAIDCANLVLLI